VQTGVMQGKIARGRTYTRIPIEERFWSKVAVADNGCWVWTAGLTYQGYGQINRSDTATETRRPMLAHRLSYEWAKGPIPDGMQVDHLCHTSACPGGRTCPHRRCVNPDHLGLATNRENTLRGSGFAARNAAKTHCPQNHPYDEANTLRDRNGGRHCHECLRASNARRIR